MTAQRIRHFALHMHICIENDLQFQSHQHMTDTISLRALPGGRFLVAHIHASDATARSREKNILQI